MPQPTKLTGLPDNQPADWDWKLTHGAAADFCLPPATVTYQNGQIPSEVWWSGGVFARTGCATGAGASGTACVTGDCLAQPGANCPAGKGGTNPATIAEFTLQRTQTDFYDVTIINGVNVAEKMQPLAQPTQAPGSHPTDYWCRAPGAKNSSVAGKDCSWDLAPYVAEVPLAGGHEDKTALLLNSTTQCSTKSGSGLPACAPGYTCSGAPGVCYKTCASDSDCGGLECVQASNGTSYCQCQNESECSSNPGTERYCGTESAPGLGIYLQQCGSFQGWWSADDFCGVATTVYGGLDCSATITDGDNNNTNLASLFGCNGAGGTGNAANEGSCYNSNDSGPGCCGCATDSANTLSKDWPTDATGSCVNNNTTWAAQIQVWLVNLKKSCPSAYTYPFDDFTSTYQCQGKGSVNLLGYRITFDDLPVPTPKRLAKILKKIQSQQP